MTKKRELNPVSDFFERVSHPRLNKAVTENIDLVAEVFYEKLDIPDYTFPQHEVLILKIKHLFVQKLISYLMENHDGGHTTLQLLKNHERQYSSQMLKKSKENKLTFEFISAADEIAKSVIENQTPDYYINFCLHMIEINRKFFI